MPFSELEWARRLLDRSCREVESAGVPALARYEVKARLGEGATAVVYHAWDRELKRPVAVKVLRESAGFNAIARERFRREAQAAAGLVHPNVVTLYDAGEEEGRLYLVMELVEGRALDGILKKLGKDERKTAALLEKVARGVAAAHEKGIVHRDLKPGNVLVTSAGDPKVGDFGLAHLVDEGAELTRTGTPLGTPLYMAPEQASGRTAEVSPRTDVYALGVILYEALAGRPPHTGPTVLEIYERVVRDDPVPIRRLNPKVARDLETVVSKALEKDPRNRYATAADLADDLRRFLAGEPVLARPLPGLVRLWRKAVKHRAVVLPTAAALILAIAWIAWAIAGNGEPSALPEEPALTGDVVFREDFERYDPKRWEERGGSPDAIKIVGGGVRGGKCLQLTARPMWIEKGAQLYRMLPPGLEACYLRFYVKLEETPHESHVEAQILGYNPPSRFPQPLAFQKPSGDQHFMTMVSPRESRARPGPPLLQVTSWWCEMKRQAGDGRFRGDPFVPRVQGPMERNRWTCVELMLKCNSAPGKADGEQALWIDGKEIGRWGDLRWRTSPALKANAILLAHYMGHVPGGREENPPRTVRVWIDEVVVSKSYVGP